MKEPEPTPSRLDILADAALGGPSLDPADDRLALAAAAAALGFLPVDEPMPAALRTRVESDADRFFRPPPARRGFRIAQLGWVAAAASWLILAALWRAPVPEAASPSPAPPFASLSAPLKATDHPLAQGAGGELVWSQARQSGLLRLRGLAGVDPRRGVYQLWIFDANRDQRYPVDGGTFTVSDPSSTTIIPIQARLPVDQPTLFAVTLEPPGGVVVSDRQRILLTAAVE